MINNTVQNKNIFKMFPDYNLELSSAVLNTKTNELQKDKITISSKKASTKKKILFGSTLATSIIGAGVLSLFLIKGAHGSSFKKMTKLKDKLARDIQETNIESTKDLMTRISLWGKKGTKKAIDGLQASSNINAIKDSAVDGILRSNKVTRPISTKSKKLFQNVVSNTLGKQYNKVQRYVDNLTAILRNYNIADLRNLDASQKAQEVTIKGVTKTLGEWIDDLAIHTQNLSKSYNKGFSRNAIVGRQRKRSKLLEGLSEKIKERFFNKKGLIKPENYKTYATEELSQAAQQELKDSIISARKKVTNNIDTICEGMKTNLNIFSQNISSNDEAAVKTVQALKQRLEKFKTCNGIDEVAQRAQIADVIADIVEKAIKSIQSNTKYSQEQQVSIISQLKSFKDSALSTKHGSKGALEEVLTILNGLNKANLQGTNTKIISDSDLKHFKKISEKISKKLEKVTDLEMGEYFLKQAELEVGSAANDVLSLVFPIGVGAYAIGKGDDKDERISATLTTCIPIVGTFATFIYGTAKMFSGAKNLIFSGVSGIVLGKLGSYCDKLYKEYRASGSVVEVAKEEYNKFWTDLNTPYAEPLKQKSET